jgi:hypothetical protein
MTDRLQDMKATTGILLVVAIAAGANVSARAAELNIVHRYSHPYRFSHLYRFWRLGPQDCFLMPDVIVAVDALGPYCSSPRGHYRRLVRRW